MKLQSHSDCLTSPVCHEQNDFWQCSVHPLSTSGFMALHSVTLLFLYMHHKKLTQRTGSLISHRRGCSQMSAVQMWMMKVIGVIAVFSSPAPYPHHWAATSCLLSESKLAHSHSVDFLPAVCQIHRTDYRKRYTALNYCRASNKSKARRKTGSVYDHMTHMTLLLA